MPNILPVMTSARSSLTEPPGKGRSSKRDPEEDRARRDGGDDRLQSPIDDDQAVQCPAEKTGGQNGHHAEGRFDRTLPRTIQEASALVEDEDHADG